jgi:hypothetical protein
MPHQEIYLALLDQQASAAMANLEKLMGNADKSTAAQLRADAIAKTIEKEYYDPEKSCYAFSHNADGSQDRTSTVYPAMAWWSELPGGKTILAHPEECLKELASHTLATDWGLRVAAVYGMGRACGVSWRAATRRIPDADGECESDALSGSRLGYGTAEWGFLCAVWEKHQPSALVERDGDYANATRALRNFD